MRIKTLHIEYTTACNSKCIMCNYWKIGRPEIISSTIVAAAIAEQYSLGLKTVYFSGGECLMFADQLFPLVQQIRKSFPQLKIGLITNGILLKKYYQEIARLFAKVIVSLDTIDPKVYKAIRGEDALEIVKSGIHQLKTHNPETQVNLRVLVLDENVKGLIPIIDFGIAEHLDRISFLPENSNSKTAFGREGIDSIKNYGSKILLPTLKQTIQQIKSNYSAEMGRLLRNNVEDLEYIYSIYSGELTCFPRCNKASCSCVIGVDGKISPCFMIKGNQYASVNSSLQEILDSDEYTQTVQDINEYRNMECKGCVCPKELT